jgi:predicted dehydrogenase
MLNAAIVGLGNWGRKIVQAVNAGIPIFNVGHAVVREVRDDLRAFARKHGIVLVTEFQQVLDNQSVDAIIITTPHSLHANQIVAAAAAGKHIFCEKPLTLTRADAVLATRACESTGRVLAVGHDKRYWSSMTALRSIVAGGTLGGILHVEGHTSNENSGHFAQWRHDAAQAPGGGMTGAGIHMLDALISVAGPVAAVVAHLRPARGGDDPRDTVSALLDFKSGITGTLSTVRTTPFYWRAHVFGDAGSAEALGATRVVVRMRGGDVEQRDFPAIDSLRAEMLAFREAMEAGRHAMKHAEMIATVHALEAILQSIATDTKVELDG